MKKNTNRSLVGAWQQKEAGKDAPEFKRLRSGYSILDPESGLVLGEIQPQKKGEGWWMSFGSDRYCAVTVGPLFTVAGCIYRLRRMRPAAAPAQPVATPSMGDRWRRAVRWLTAWSASWEPAKPALGRAAAIR